MKNNFCKICKYFTLKPVQKLLYKDIIFEYFMYDGVFDLLCESGCICVCMLYLYIKKLLCCVRILFRVEHRNNREIKKITKRSIKVDNYFYRNNKIDILTAWHAKTK